MTAAAVEASADEAALLARIRATPDDDVPRLVYADWLDDQGEHERAAFIRVGCERCRIEEVLCHQSGAKLLDWCNDTLCPKCGRDTELKAREFDLLEWFCNEDMAVFFGLPNHETLFQIEDGLSAPGLGVRLRLARGFVEVVTCPAHAWLAHGDAILARHPVRDVTLTTWTDASALVERWPGVRFTLPSAATPEPRGLLIDRYPWLGRDHAEAVLESSREAGARLGRWLAEQMREAIMAIPIPTNSTPPAAPPA